MSKASLRQWLARLETLHPDEMDLGLDRISAVAHALKLLPLSVPVITVSGTNGKGSTSAVLEATLVEVGQRVGVCSSPHFLRFNERIRVGGVEVGDGPIIDAFETIEAAREDISLTYFEFATLAALLVFRTLGVEFVILEVGLGGRLDAVNIVDAPVAVITSIELDHQQWLGDTRELIAVEKAGIFRRGQKAVIAEPDPPLSLLEAAREAGVDALYLGRDFHVESHPGRWRGILRNIDGSSRHLPELATAALLPVNICAALQALHCADVVFSDQQLSSALAGMNLPGRRERRELAGSEYILDVAHNPASVIKLLEFIDLTPCKGRTIALFSVMADKDVKAMVQSCAGRFDSWFLADQADNKRACAAADLAEILRGEGNQLVNVSSSIPQAFRCAQREMTGDDRLVIFGSFFTVAAVMPLLEPDPGVQV